MGRETLGRRTPQLAPGDGLLLVHGLAANRWLMRSLEKRFRQQSLSVLNWGYPSTRRTIASHAAEAEALLLELTSDRSGFLQPGRKLHLVSHSLGCIVLRAALARQAIPHLGHWVMLAPPNRGSYVARHLARIFGSWVPPLGELSDHPDSYVNRLPDFTAVNPIPFGVIEARRDRVIASANVRLDGQADHVVIDSHHGMLPWHPDTGPLVEQFLQTGRFRSGLAPTIRPRARRGVGCVERVGQ